MLIKSLNSMEKIVSQNKALGWDGWSVTDSKPSPTAWRSKDGVYVNGQWFLQRRYEITPDGWHIPRKFVR